MNHFQGGNDALLPDDLCLAGSGWLRWRKNRDSRLSRVRREVALHCGKSRSALPGRTTFGLGENRRREALRAEWERTLQSIKEWLARWAIDYQTKRKHAWHQNGLQRDHRARHKTLPFLRWIEPPACIPLVEGCIFQSVRKVSICMSTCILRTTGVIATCWINRGKADRNRSKKTECSI